MSQQPLFVPASDGWYARPGDPPGMTRHWDGKAWQCEVRGPIKDHFNHLRSMVPEQRSPQDQELLKQLTRDVSTIEDLVLGNPSDNPPLVPIQTPPPYIPPPTASYAPPQPMYAGPPPAMMPPQAPPMLPMYQAQPPVNAGPPQMYQGQPPMMPPRGPAQPPMMLPQPAQAQAPAMPPQPAQAQPPAMAPQPVQAQPMMVPPAPVMPLAPSPEPASVQTPVTAPAPSMTPQWPAAVQPQAMAAQPPSAQSPMMPPPSAPSPAMMPQPGPAQPMMAPPMPQPGPAQPPVSMPQPPTPPYGTPSYLPDSPELAAPAPKRKSRKALLVAIPLVLVLALAGVGYAFRSKLPFVSSTAALSVNSCVTLSTPAGSSDANTVTWSASECTTAAAGPVSYVVVSKLPGAAQCDPDSQYVQTLSGSTVEYTYCLMENLTEGQCVYEDAKGLMFDVPCSDTRALVKVGVRADQGTGYSCPTEMTAWRFPAGNRTYCLSKP